MENTQQTEIIYVRVTPDLKSKLEALAEREHRPLSGQVRHMLAVAVEEKKDAA